MKYICLKLLLSYMAMLWLPIASAADLNHLEICNKAADVEKKSFFDDFGTDKGFKLNRCGSDNVFKLADGSILVIASYDTPVGYVPYVINFRSDTFKVICESINESCLKRKYVTKIIQSRLNRHRFKKITADGKWGSETEKALWEYANSVSLNKNNSHLLSVVLSMMSGYTRKSF